MSKYININPETGDWIVEGGSFTTTDSLQPCAYNLLKCPVGQWQHAPYPNFGSRLNEIKKNLSTQYPSPVENSAAAALKPLINSKRAKRIDVTAERMTRFSVYFSTKIYQSNNKIEEFQLPGI